MSDPRWLCLSTLLQWPTERRSRGPANPAIMPSTPSATLCSSPSTGVLLRAQVALSQFSRKHSRKCALRKSAPRPWTPAPPSILDSSRFPLHASRLRWITAFSLPRAPDHQGTATGASSLSLAFAGRWSSACTGQAFGQATISPLLQRPGEPAIDGIAVPIASSA
jgi:hypothetical protein